MRKLVTASLCLGLKFAFHLHMACLYSVRVRNGASYYATVNYMERL